MSRETATKSYHRLIAQGKNEKAERIFSAKPEWHPNNQEEFVKEKVIQKKRGRHGKR